MKQLIFILYILITFAKADSKTLNVLVFQSYHETIPWTQQIIKGLDKFKKNYDGDINFYLESVDQIRLKHQMDPLLWKNYLKNKYKTIKFNGILIDTIYATETFNQFSNELYPKIPKIYYVDTNITKDQYSQTVNELDVSMITKTISLAQKQNPNLENIYVIKSDKGGETLEAMLLQSLYKSSLNLHYIDNFTMDSLKQTLKNLPKNSAVFYGLTFFDKTGRSFIPKEFLKKIAKVCNTPIYSFWNTFLDTGTVGGYMVDGETSIMQIMHSLTNHINKGHFLDNIQTYKLMLDYSAMEKYNLSMNQIPSEATIINKPIPVWETYPYETIIALSIISVLSISLTFAIIIKIRNEKIKKMEESMFLQSRQAAMGEMISVIAHQWRQPLNNISAIVQTINLKYLKDTLNDEIMSNFKSDVLKQIQYMSNTVDDFRNFYKPNQNKIDFNIKTELIKILELIQKPFNQENILIKKELCDDFFINGHPNELGQCFLIILQNAKDAFLNNNNFHQRTIKVSLQAKQNVCLLYIEDNAGGIPNKIINKIFDPYFSTKNLKQGTGLGLYMAKTIIEKYTIGEINVQNTQSGAKFEIRIGNDN